MRPLPLPRHPALAPEVLDLLEDRGPVGRLPRERRARLLERALVDLDRFQPLLEIRLGQVLAPLVRGGYRDLGSVTPSGFCREELGLSATAAWDLVRLAEGLLGRPALREAFLAGRLPRTHALELLRLDPGEDEAWAARAAGLPVRELRRALGSRRPAPAERREARRMRTWELEPEPYATWLAAVELGRRREGRDLDPGAVIEQVVAEFFSGRTAPLGGEAVLGAEGDASASRLGDPADPAARGLLLLDAARPAVEPGSTLPLADTWGVANSADPAGPAPLLPEAGALSGAAPCSAEGASPSSLPSLLLEPLPPGPRRLAREAARLLGLREHTELLRGRLLRRVQEGRLYGEGGHRNFRSWLVARGLAPSTAFQATARDLQLDRHPEVRRALHEGRLSPTKADLLLRLRPRAEAASWLEYARTRTCRRLEEAVEVALVMATRFPLAWARRGRRPPGEDESMDEFREQAGLVSLESALGDLARAFGATAGVQTSAQASDPSGPAPPTPGATAGVQTSAQAEDPSDPAPPAFGATAGVQTSAQVAPTGRTIRLRVSLPEAVERLLGAAEAELRRQAGRALPAEDCLEVLLLVFLGEAGGERGPARGRLPRQVLERAGYRCEVPGCASRTNLHLHHLQRRSQGGADSLENLVVLCSAHHLRHAHGGRMRVEGDDPATRVWELGLEGGGNPWRVYVDERLVDGAALSEDAGEGEDSADLGNPRDLEGDSDSGADRVREVPAEYRAA